MKIIADTLIVVNNLCSRKILCRGSKRININIEWLDLDEGGRLKRFNIMFINLRIKLYLKNSSELISLKK